MKILSLDIGIKNLAFCLFEKTNDSTYFSIKQWDSIDLTEETDICLCSFLDEKTNILCCKPAKYTTTTSSKDENNKYFCLKHSKKQTNFFIPTTELTISSLKKQKFQSVLDIADKYNISYQKPIKKTELIQIIESYIHNHCFKEIISKNASKIDLITVGKNIKTKFNRIFLKEDKITHVIIENQISPIANRMKTIQGMVVQYFIMNDSAEHIEFVSSSNKLKNIDSKYKASYNARKKIGIDQCLEIIKTHPFENNLEHFLSHKKKDDLADSFLQGLWYITDRQK
jgi:hypothetical protein